MFILLLVTLIAYSSAFFLQIASLSLQRKVYQSMVFFFVLLGLVTNTLLLYTWIESTQGAQNLTLVNIVALLAWFSTLVTVLIAFFFPVSHLLLLLIPATLASVFLASFYSGSYLINTGESYAQLFHILLSFLVAGILLIGAFQALLIKWQNLQLKRHHPNLISMGLPALEQMEKVLFAIVWIGFVFLTVLLASSFFAGFWFDAFPRFEKTIIASVTWLVFLVLLVGRYGFGWRANVAANWTLLGVTLLLLIYPLGRWLYHQ